MFVDEITLHMKAGNGGNGVVRWRHEKGREFAGAAGGNGGNGGSVYLRGVRDIGILASYRHKKDFRAERGEDGMKKSMFGRNGGDLHVDVPIGSIVTDARDGREYEVLKEGEEVLVLKGGRGGLGNEHFKASTNTTPWEQTNGKEGEVGDFHIELELMVDVGFVGFPNAGKSSLLNALTNATAKVASYAFTTLEPNLGDFYGYILADIPGLIEGASDGKGLGYKFLRHIKRTKILLHCVSLENEDISAAYKTIRQELASFDAELAHKPEILLLTKTDLITPAELKKKMTIAKKLNKNIFVVSVINDEEMKEFADSLSKILKKA